MKRIYSATCLIILQIICAHALLHADDSTHVQRTLAPTRISMPPSIDGYLSDECWSLAVTTGDFTTNSPVFGNVPLQATKVWVAYDDNAVYVAAYLYDTEPGKIMAVLTTRDGGSSKDNFVMAFDTYHDGQNAFRFEVSATGVQSDGKMSLDDFDDSWNPVWQCATRMVDDGWVAEVRIPYSAIRFPEKSVQEWGAQFARTIQRVGEYSTWSPIDPSKNNPMSQWGLLTNLEHIEPPIRLSLSPYVAGYVEHIPTGTTPVAYSNGYSVTGGLDLKYGINESFTLDATLIPDFGQVQSDNVTLNLGPFETQYDENRPFFTEGTELFSKGNIFYSRRIGGTPTLCYDVPYMIGANERIKTNPTQQQLYNATKVSGRTASGLGLAVLNAVVAPSYASIENDSTGETRRIRTGELTNYNILVFDQTLPNNSSVSLTNTNVMRNGDARDANVSNLSASVFDNTNTYMAFANGALSLINQPVAGDSMATGYKYNIGLSKVGGEFRFDLSHRVVGKTFDPNDLGIQYGYNEMNEFAGVKYNNYTPSGLFLNWGSYLGVSYTMKYDSLAYQSLNINFGADASFTNRWYASWYFTLKPIDYYDYYEPRVEGRKFRHAPVAFGGVYVQSNSSYPFFVGASFNFGESTMPDDPYVGGSLNLRYRISDRLNLEANLSGDKDLSSWGFVDFMGQDIIFGRRDVATSSVELGIGYIFTPKMNVQFRARHYWSNVEYQQFYTLLDDGGVGPTTFTGNYDHNFTAFNMDVVYEWEFAAGSTINLIWKNGIAEDTGGSKNGYLSNLINTFKSPQANTLALKVIYYLDYADLKHAF